LSEDFIGYYFTVAPDNLSVDVTSVDNLGPGVVTTMEEAVQYLAEGQGVTHGIMEERLKSIIENKEIVKNEKIAEATMPVQGEDGYIDYKVDVSSKPHFIPDPDSEKVDFRQAIQVTFLQVGDIVGEIVPPTDGVPGKNVKGESLAATPGLAVKVTLDKGLEQKGNQIIATAAGAPFDRGGRMGVKQVYEVAGDVDFSVGNIDFPGTVIINGEIQDDFEVTAGEDIIVKGVVNAAKLKAVRNIQVFGGIIGREKAQVIAGGNLEALFCSEAYVQADGDILITKDVNHCKMFSLATIDIGGAVVGGEINAVQRIQAGVLGNETGTKTYVNIRTSYKLKRMQAKNEAVLKQGAEIGERAKSYTNAQKLNDEQLVALREDIQTIRGLIASKKNLDKQIEKLQKQLADVPDVHIDVTRQLNTDVWISAPFCHSEIVQKSTGKFIITDDVDSGKMKVKRG